MINHDLRCIFIHIPRTGGTSIEFALCGQDWWHVAPNEKHFIASQARRAYPECWDAYFKFSLVRHPFTRFSSMIKYPEMFFGKELDHVTSQAIDSYCCRYGSPVTVEYDYRFFEREEVERRCHEPGTVYGNILDEQLDFIGRFENLREDFERICEYLRTATPALPIIEATDKRNLKDEEALTEEAKALIQRIWWKDFVRFDYTMTSVQTD